MDGLLRFRHNVMNITTISGFENIKGGVNNRCKDVYFVRALGAGPGYADEIKKMDDVLDNLMNSGRGYYKRLNGLPKLQDMGDTAYYSESYTKWAQSDKKKAVTRSTEGNGILEDMLGNACSAVEEICMQEKAQMTDSMRKNLIVKMLFWYDSIFGKEEFLWDEKKTLKVVAANVEKKQEYLFFYLLTLMGCDVLLLQSRKDIGEEEERLGLSVKFVLGDYAETVIPEYVRGQKQECGRESVNAGQTAAEPAAARGGQEGRIQVVIPPRERHNRHAAPQTGAGGTASQGTGNSSGAAVSQRPEVPPRVTVPPRPGTSRGAAVMTAGNRNSVQGEETEKSFEELAQLASSVVMIAIHDNKGEVIGTGSGIMVGRDGYILTNNHVASGGKYYSVRIEDDEKVYSTDEVIKYNYVLDLAVIRIDRKLIPIPIYHGPKPLVRGQKVVAIGSPLGLFNSVSDGIISGFRKIDNVDMIQFTAPTSHGSSGGAVLNMQGEVIGISTAGFDSGQNINLAMGYECINNFVRGFT